MPLTPSFSITESIGSPGTLTFTDTSTGEYEGVLSSRLIYIQLSDGTYLVPEGTETDYIIWPYADASLTIEVLPRSQAADVTVRWVAGTSIPFTVETPFCFPFFDYVFAFNKIRVQASQPNIIDNRNFYNTSIAFIVNLWNAEVAVEIGEDIGNSQLALDRNYYLIQNPQLYR